MSNQGSKTFRRHLSALQSGVVGESFIRGVCSATNNADRREQGLSVSRTYSGMSLDEVRKLWDCVSINSPRIEATQSAKGLAWLQSKRIQRELGLRERDIVTNFSHFTLDGLIDAGERVAFVIPVYKVHAKDGRTFTYYKGSWQSGIPFSIVD